MALAYVLAILYNKNSQVLSKKTTCFTDAMNEPEVFHWETNVCRDSDESDQSKQTLVLNSSQREEKTNNCIMQN